MNATGHMVLAQIAWDNMSSQTRSRVTQLLKDPNNPNAGLPTEANDDDMPDAADWMDDFKSVARKEHLPDDEGRYHFDDTPVGDSQYFPRDRSADTGVTYFNQQVGVLQNSSSSQDQCAEALRDILHLCGDIGAQPLHCVSRFNAEHPSGDKGGNDFKISWGGTGRYDTDLHALWDEGGAHASPRDPSKAVGLFPYVKRPMTDESRQFVENIASKLEHQYPSQQYTTQQLNDQNPQDWVDTLSQQADQVAYQGVNEGDQLSPDSPYRATVEKTMGSNVALAGYRLANLLNGMFDGSSAQAAAR
ncbi:MAG TPA: S1/P1 nuclease [Candidatus Xenobia bacterium]